MAFAGCHRGTTNVSESQLPLRRCHLRMAAMPASLSRLSPPNICKWIRFQSFWKYVKERARAGTYWPSHNVPGPFPPQPIHVCLLCVHCERMRSEFSGTHIAFMAFLFQSASELISGNVIPESRREVHLSSILATSSPPSSKAPLSNQSHERITYSSSTVQSEGSITVMALYSSALDPIWNNDCEIKVLTPSFNFIGFIDTELLWAKY